MKRLLSLLVTGSLLVTPVLAAQTGVEDSFPAVREPASFADVASGSWYTDAAGLCYATGLLNGTGSGNFSPSRSVTIGEAATLAARIHHILSGGDGTLPEAPAEWGQVVFTRAGGASAGFHENSETGFWLDEKSLQLYFHLDESWKAAHGQAVTLTLNGTDYSGTLTERGDGSFSFQLSDATRDYENYTADLWDALWRPAPGNWSRNTAYYLETVLHTGPDQINGLGETATRLDFVKLLSLVSGDLLEPINDIADFPDATEETKDVVLPFYQAGILTGTDDYGTFRANGTLSRAEMATMAARLIRPELRQEFTLKTVDDSRYTLTALDLKGGQAEGSWSTSSLLPVTYEDRWALYRADGSWYTPEEGTAFLDANEDGLVMMQAADDSYAVADSTKDWAAVPFTPNWSCKLLGDGLFISQPSYGADPILHDRTGASIATLTGGGHWDVLDWPPAWMRAPGCTALWTSVAAGSLRPSTAAWSPLPAAMPWSTRTAAGGSSTPAASWFSPAPIPSSATGAAPTSTAPPWGRPTASGSPPTAPPYLPPPPPTTARTSPSPETTSPAAPTTWTGTSSPSPPRSSTGPGRWMKTGRPLWGWTGPPTGSP